MTTLDAGMTFCSSTVWSLPILFNGDFQGICGLNQWESDCDGVVGRDCNRQHWDLGSLSSCLRDSNSRILLMCRAKTRCYMTGELREEQAGLIWVIKEQHSHSRPASPQSQPSQGSENTSSKRHLYPTCIAALFTITNTRSNLSVYQLVNGYRSCSIYLFM